MRAESILPWRGEWRPERQGLPEPRRKASQAGPPESLRPPKSGFTRSLHRPGPDSPSRPHPIAADTALPPHHRARHTLPARPGRCCNAGLPPQPLGGAPDPFAFLKALLEREFSNTPDQVTAHLTAVTVAPITYRIKHNLWPRSPRACASSSLPLPHTPHHHHRQRGNFTGRG